MWGKMKRDLCRHIKKQLIFPLVPFVLKTGAVGFEKTGNFCEKCKKYSKRAIHFHNTYFFKQDLTRGKNKVVAYSFKVLMLKWA